MHILSGIFRWGECLYCVLMELFETAELINFCWRSMFWNFLKVLFKSLDFLNYFCSRSSSLRCILALLGRQVSFKAGFSFNAAGLSLACSDEFILIPQSSEFPWSEHIFPMCPNCFTPPGLRAFW